MKKRIKINAVVIFLSLLVVAFFSFKLIRSSTGPLDDFLEVLGISLILFGQLLRVSGRGYKAEHSANGHSLIKSGPYAMVRNPMYLGIILIGLGVVLFIFHLWAFLIFAVIFISRYLHLVIKEEKNLLKAFGEDYKKYQKNTPRLLPRLSFLFKTDIQEYLPVKLSWFKREAASIAIVLFAVFWVEYWEDAGIDKGLVALTEWLPFLAVISVYFILIIFLARRYENLAKKSKNPG
jgi:protein-S-isoprenylcysteine O-methyltransferase Ste14